MTDAQLAFQLGTQFDDKITSVFWSSFKGEYGRMQAAVLVQLYSSTAAQASEIAEVLNIPKQHVSKIVKGFENEALVEVHAIQSDRRANSISLTEKGRACVERHLRESDEHFNRLLEKLTDKKKAAFRAAMQSLNEILSEL